MKAKSMKSVLITLIMVLGTIVTTAQKNNQNDFNIELGKPYTVIDANGNNYFTIDDKVYALKLRSDGYYFQRFDISNLRQEIKKVLRGFPKSYVPEFIKEINNNLYVFYSLWENGREHFITRKVDLAKGSFVEEPKLLVDVDDKVSGWMAGETKRYGVAVEDKFKFINSNNDSVFLVTYKRLPVKNINSQNYDVIGLSIFDINFNKIWSKEVKMPHTEKKLDIVDYFVDNNGTVYILTTLFKNRVTDKEVISGKPNYKYEILKIDSGNDTEIISLSLDGKIISSLSLLPDAENGIYAAGYYINKKNNSEDAKGSFVINIDDKGIPVSKTVAEFPLDLINQYESKKTIKKNSKIDIDEVVLPYLNIKDILKESDGSILLIGEQEHILEYSDKVVEYYDNIIVSKFDPADEQSWTKKLPKKQRSGRYNMGFSFKHFYYDQNHYFLFMENPKTFNLDINEEPEVYIGEPGSCLSQYHLNSKTGDFSKSQLFNSDKVDKLPIYYFSPWRMVNTNEGIYIFETYKKNKQDILIKATLK